MFPLRWLNVHNRSLTPLQEVRIVHSIFATRIVYTERTLVVYCQAPCSGICSCTLDNKHTLLWRVWNRRAPKPGGTFRLRLCVNARGVSTWLTCLVTWHLLIQIEGAYPLRRAEDIQHRQLRTTRRAVSTCDCIAIGIKHIGSIFWPKHERNSYKTAWYPFPGSFFVERGNMLSRIPVHRHFQERGVKFIATPESSYHVSWRFVGHQTKAWVQAV